MAVIGAAALLNWSGLVHPGEDVPWLHLIAGTAVTSAVFLYVERGALVFLLVRLRRRSATTILTSAELARAAEALLREIVITHGFLVESRPEREFHLHLDIRPTLGRQLGIGAAEFRIFWNGTGRSPTLLNLARSRKEAVTLARRLETQLGLPAGSPVGLGRPEAPLDRYAARAILHETQFSSHDRLLSHACAAAHPA